MSFPIIKYNFCIWVAKWQSPLGQSCAPKAMPPRRAATRTAVSRASEAPDDQPTRTKRGSRAVVDSDQEDNVEAVPSDASEASESEEEKVKKPTRKPAGKTAAKRAPAKRATTSTKARAAKALADEDDENDVEEDPIPVKKSTLKGRPKSKAAAAPVSRKPSQAVSVAQEDSDLDEPLDIAPSLVTPRPSQKRPIEPISLDEEENIVLESPSKRPPPIFSPIKQETEESKGPKPRLVIHKIVLVNFKSYAGRQEIGPFHKVNTHKMPRLTFNGIF